ncbi:MAG TPA: hypothetical protein VJB14_18600 [Planctomycetota bacterium]|nr:hypothetical protein [Planctomycetota bacterium]
MEKAAPQPGRLAISGEKGGLQIVLPMRRNGYLITLLSAWLVVWLAAEAALVAALLGWEAPWGRGLPPAPLPLLLLTLALTLAGALVLWRWLWNLSGKKILTITEGHVKIRQQVGSIGTTKAFEISKIRNLSAKAVKQDPRFFSPSRLFFGSARGYLSFEYEGRVHRFGHTLNELEARHLVQVMREWIDAD